MNLKKLLFTLTAVMMPLVFLGMVELSLRLFDAYAQAPLFETVEKDGQILMQVNSRVGERYFNKRIMPVPNLYPQTFTREKGTDVFRVMCLGGSTTAGFPYEMTVPFPKQLELLLEKDDPGRAYEVINLGLSAINSFTVIDWIPEILEQDPDLILIYMGHNEFYGAYGTGSTISLGHDGRLVRLVLKLQKLHLVQMVGSWLKGSGEPEPDADTATLMEKVIDDRFISTNSILRFKTRENFSDNLDVILNACQTEEVPVILSTLVSNLKDQRPLDMTSRPSSPATKAEKLYQKGLLQFAQGDTVTAHLSFTLARNTDQVPFRANEYLNRTIEDKAATFQIPLVNMESAFDRASRFGIPGHDLFCDHLHPNPIGYNLMAVEFLKAINQTGLLPVKNTSLEQTEPLLVTELDWEIGDLKIFKLLQRWPFGNGSVDYSLYRSPRDSAAVRIARDYLFDHQIWGRAHSEMADHWVSAGQLAKACREYQAIIEIYPEKMEYYSKLVECAKRTRQYDLLERTCEAGIQRFDEKGMFHYHLAIARRLHDNMASALQHIEAAMEAPELTRTQSANVYFTYARFLLDMRQPAEAAEVLSQLVQEMPEFTPAQDLLKQLLN